jgi:hypothetical protein
VRPVLTRPALTPYMRFDIRKRDGGWTVFDRFTGTPAEIAGVAQIELVVEDAEGLKSGGG